jgi:DNA-binding response OmpR family regulator
MSTILIIEDDKAQRDALQRALETAGFSVLAAEDGTAGIRLAKELSPDLIVCDIEMPGLNGFQTLEGLRADEQTSEIPFVFLTGSVNAMEGRLGRELGAEEFIEKPFSFSKLLAIVTTKLQK